MDDGDYQVCGPMRKLLATNANSSSFPSKIPTITEPTGDGILALSSNINGGLVPRRIKLWPIVAGADNDTSSMRVIGWQIAIKDGATSLWVPTVIGEFACTACTIVGIAGAVVINTDRFCDTITPVAARNRDQVLAAGTGIGSEYEILSGGAGSEIIAHIVMPIMAFQKIEFNFDQTLNSPTQNVLYQFLV